MCYRAVAGWFSTGAINGTAAGSSNVRLDLYTEWHADDDLGYSAEGARHMIGDANLRHNMRNAMNIDYPYHIDHRGRTAAPGTDNHIRDMIEQVLFTSPGERVNRPTFGCGLIQLVFAPNGPELAAATQFLVQGSLQQWLGNVIQVDAVEIGSQDSTIYVTVVYTVRRTQQKQSAQFTRQI
jgi:uncharacterized protein